VWLWTLPLLKLRQLGTRGAPRHKVLVYTRLLKCMSPRRNWDSPNPSPASECPPPLNQMEGGTLAYWWGVGGVPIPTTGEKAKHSAYSVGCTYERGPSLVGWLGSSCHAGTRYFCPALSALPCSRPNTKYFFPHRTLFHFICLHHPASSAGSRAGLRVS
jgi:hypothetical protein